MRLKEKIIKQKMFKLITLMLWAALTLSISQILGPKVFSLVVQNLEMGLVDDKDGTKSVPLGLFLKTRKTLYRAGEAIELTVYLENKSMGQSCYIVKDLDTIFVRSLEQGINVSIMNSNSEDVAPIIMTNKIRDKKKIEIDDVSSFYLELAPKMIYGISERLDDVKLKPGTYNLRARYYDDVPTYWSEAERKSLAISFCARRLNSNMVRITVTR